MSSPRLRGKVRLQVSEAMVTHWSQFKMQTLQLPGREDRDCWGQSVRLVGEGGSERGLLRTRISESARLGGKWMVGWAGGESVVETDTRI